MNVDRERKKKVSKKEYTWAFWAVHVSELFPIVFFPFLEENPERKHLNPITFFSTPPQTPIKTSFSPKFSILSKISPDKHTLRVVDSFNLYGQTNTGSKFFLENGC